MIMSDNIVQMDHIQKSYDGVANILEDVSFTVNRGEFIVIRGASGSGKSTLLNVLGLLDAFDSGYYKLNDFSIESDKFNRYSDLRSKLLGFVFQSYHLIDSLSITDNILLPFIYSDEYITSEIIERMNIILESFDLIESKDKKTALLSGGEKQRVAIARAIIKSPPLVIADEPTGNLDNENTDVVIGYLKNLTKQSTSVIMVTHDTGLLKYSDRNYLLYEGRLV